MTLIRTLAEFVTQADASRLPELDREILQRHATDIAGARILGGLTEEGKKIQGVFQSGMEGIGGLAGIVRLTEMDDIHTAATSTPSSISVPIAFALYKPGQDPREIESAIYVGTEILVRFGKAMNGAAALFQGFWPTRSGGTLGAAATACRILGLSLGQTEQALSLAILTSAGRGGRFVREPSGRWIVLANSVANGLRMTEAARCGFMSVENVLDGDWIGATMGLPILEAQLTHMLGEGSVFPELSLKPYSTARQSLGGTEAMLGLMSKGLDRGSIKNITLRVPTSHKGMISQKLDPHCRGTAFVSAACQIATAALAPDSLYDVERRDVLNNPHIAALASKVEIVGDPELDRDFPEIWAAEIEVLTTSGTVRNHIRDSLGSPGNRMDNADLLLKYRQALNWFGRAGRADEVMSLGANMFRDPVAAGRMASTIVNG